MIQRHVVGYAPAEGLFHRESENGHCYAMTMIPVAGEHDRIDTAREILEALAESFDSRLPEAKELK